MDDADDDNRFGDADNDFSSGNNNSTTSINNQSGDTGVDTSAAFQDLPLQHNAANDETEAAHAPFDPAAIDDMAVEKHLVAPLPEDTEESETAAAAVLETIKAATVVAPHSRLSTKTAPAVTEEKGKSTTEAATSDTTEPEKQAEQPTKESALPSPSKMTFYAIRKGTGLKGPAILTSWEDAKVFCEVEKTEVEYKEFPAIQQAVQYLQEGGGLPKPPAALSKAAPKKRKSSTPTASAAAPKKRPRKTVLSTDTRIKQSEFDKIMAQLQEFKKQNHHVQVPGPFSKTVPVAEKFMWLAKWMKMIRQAVKQYQEEGPQACPLTEIQLQQLADIGFISKSMLEEQSSGDDKQKKKKAGTAATSKPRMTNSDSRWKTPTSAHHLLKLSKELEETWDDRIALLEEYKTDKGHANVPKRPNKTIEQKYVPLCKWAGWMVKFLGELEESTDKTHFFLNQSRVQQLEEIGFESTSTRKKTHSPLDADFDEMLTEFKRIKAANAPLKTNRQLEFWIAEQRKQYELFKEKKESTITPERVEAMAEAGFPFQKKQWATWEEMAVEWLEFRKRMGRDPMRDESTLYQWVYKQRVKYKQKMEGTKKNNLTDEQIQRLSDWGFNWEFKFTLTDVAPRASWETRFEELVKYKEENGNCQVHKNYKVLGQWVKQQRKDYRYFVQGSKPSRMTQERIAKLSSIGFDFGEKRWNTVSMKTAHTAIEKGKMQDAEQQELQEQGHMLQNLRMPGGGGEGDVSDEDDLERDDDRFNQRNNYQMQQSIAPWEGYRTFNNNMQV